MSGCLTALRGRDATGGPRAGPVNNSRRVALRHLDQRIRDCLVQLEDDIDTAPATRVRVAGLSAAIHDGARVWIHGDLHPGNLVVREEHPSGMIDFLQP